MRESVCLLSQSKSMCLQRMGSVREIHMLGMVMTEVPEIPWHASDYGFGEQSKLNQMQVGRVWGAGESRFSRNEAGVKKHETVLGSNVAFLF